MLMTRPTLAVHKFSSCDGCQLQILNMEDEILDLAEVIDIAYFLEATRATRPGPYTISMVEGSVTTEHEIERIKKIRDESKILISIGTCATAGGIQALRNVADADEYANIVYPNPEYLSYLKTASPISDYVDVDMELWGCPVDKKQLLEVIVALLQNRRPVLLQSSVCMECKQAGTICVLVAEGTPCIGPATRAGCGAVCPTMGRGCYGCFGPQDGANTDSLSDILTDIERYPGETERLFNNISNFAPAFHEAASKLKD
ncbi:MAG: oxidoreductase [Anaerolineae bacterium]|nr:oxidoreductase [Anaerolineae bacterium]MBT4309579.1 oxidoreductase [Anaerolineae bacterium]MBT4458818.1 oxidoreductase [Anaerolineae bacterium]MBT4842665.1 oxidoreductase [Anaerolineae bacterium]MBT6059945.1 oxidoreductase [Anaerolineae bacterium]